MLLRRRQPGGPVLITNTPSARRMKNSPREIERNNADSGAESSH